MEGNTEENQAPGELKNEGAEKPRARYVSSEVKKWARMFARPVMVQLREALFLVQPDGSPMRPCGAVDEDLNLIMENGAPKEFVSYSPTLQVVNKEPVCQYALCPVMLNPDRSGQLIAITAGHGPTGSIFEILVEPSLILAVTEIVQVPEPSRIARV